MTYKLVFPESYIRRARKFLGKHPEIHGQYRKALQLLELNPFHPSLRLHSLEGRLSGLSSVSINISYRIIIELIIKEDEILFVSIGKDDTLASGLISTKATACLYSGS